MCLQTGATTDTGTLAMTCSTKKATLTTRPKAQPELQQEFRIDRNER
jgi:hypothetical protein